MVDAFSLCILYIGTVRVTSIEIVIIHIILLNCLDSLNFEVAKMLTSSTESILEILIRESSSRAVVFTLELQWGQALSLVFTNPDIIVGLVYKHTTVKPIVVQRLVERKTLLVFAEGENIENYVEHYDPLNYGWVTV